jgi:glucoamylase
MKRMLHPDHHCHHPAPGGPGAGSVWAPGNKDAVGTAYDTSSPVWYTLAEGIITEVYYPTIDSPQMRDLQYIVTDGQTFLHDERRDMAHQIEIMEEYGLGVRVTSSPPDERYRLVKEIFSAPDESCLLMHTRLEGEEQVLDSLRLFLLWNPHIEGGGMGNHGEVHSFKGQRVLVAYRDESQAVVGLTATVPFGDCSCGFVGVNDGWTDLQKNRHLSWQYECAHDGNIALVGELELEGNREWLVGLAFGQGLHHMLTVLYQSLSLPIEGQRRRFQADWEQASVTLPDLEEGARGLPQYPLGPVSLGRSGLWRVPPGLDARPGAEFHRAARL